MSVTSLRYGLHYNVLLEMMMSVLQEVEGLTKNLYSIILPVERPVSMQNFRLNVYTVRHGTTCVYIHMSRFFSLEQEKAYHFYDMHMDT